MTLRSFIPICLLVAASPLAGAQSPPTLPELLAQAIAASPAVAAQEFRVQQARSAAAAAGAPINPTLDIAPGVGFTNSNFTLGQSFDLSGTRAAQAQQARAEIDAAAAGLRRARSAVAIAFLDAYAHLLASRERVVSSEAGLMVAQSTLSVVTDRVGLGEAPAVQKTRAELEVTRADQLLTIARAELAASTVTLVSILGRVVPLQATWLEYEASTAAGTRPELQEAQAHVESARGAALEARRLGRPDLFAGLASDVWSLDRMPFERQNVGVQIQLTMPLWDRGENRHTRRAAEAAVKAREAEYGETKRQIEQQQRSAAVRLRAHREVATSYQSGVVPKARQLVAAMQAGMQAGLTGFLELLEAQRTLTELHGAAIEATLASRLAEVNYLAAMGQLPGVEGSK